MKKIGIIISMLFLCVVIYSQKPLTVGLSGANTRAAINSNFDTLYVSNTIRVSESRGYGDIQAAIDVADAGSVVIVYPGTYTITSEIVTKNGVDLYFMPGSIVYLGSNVANAINIQGDTIDIHNLYVRSISATAGAMLNINNSFVGLYNVVIDHRASVQSAAIINNSYLSGTVDLISTDDAANVFTIDSSDVKIRSNKFHGVVTTTGNTSASFNIIEQIQQINQYSDAQGESKLSLYVFSQRYINQSTGLDYDLLTSKANYARVRDSATLVIEHKQLMGAVISSDKGDIILSNSIGTYNGKVLIFNAGTATINNCNMVMDIEDTTTGLHLFEGVDSSAFIINGGYYEFTGYRGMADTYGSLHERGSVVGRNATFVSREHPNAGYKQVFKVEGASIELYNCNIISGSTINGISLIGSATKSSRAILMNNSFDIPIGLKFLSFNNTANSTTSDTIEIIGNSSINRSVFYYISESGFIERRENRIMQERSIGGYLTKNLYGGGYGLSAAGGETDTLTVTVTYIANAYTSKLPVIIDRLYISMYMNSSDYAGIYKLGFASRGSSGNNYRYWSLTKLTERANSGNWVIPVIAEGTSGTSSITFTIVNNAAAAVTVKLQAFDTDYVSSITAIAH